MNELIETRSSKRYVRRQLLATVSALALLGAVYGTGESKAADHNADRPTVWIELGGQFEQISTGQDVFAPPFTNIEPVSGPARPAVVQIPPGIVQKPLDYSYSAEGNISFQPEGSDWVFTAAVRYGRSNGSKHIQRSAKPLPAFIVSRYVTRHFSEFASATSKRSESHAILDFEAGRDFGLGIFGANGHSTMKLGVRFAQFHSALQASLGLDPDTGGYKYIGPITLPTNNPHAFLGQAHSTRNFRGVGPSVSWDGSAQLAGSSDHAEFTFDWGANAAILFGRQKTSIHHQTTAQTFPTQQDPLYLLAITVYQHAADHARSRSVVVPNIGGLAGVSLRFPNAKLSLGYRADFFFGAMDGGLDTRKSEDVGFHGPFATISIGLGG